MLEMVEKVEWVEQGVYSSDNFLFNNIDTNITIGDGGTGGNGGRGGTVIIRTNDINMDTLMIFKTPPDVSGGRGGSGGSGGLGGSGGMLFQYV